MNENRPLEEADFHIFTKKDLNEVECLMDLALFFEWDAYLVSPSQKFVASPNDEIIYISCDKSEDAKHFRELFGRMNFKEK